MFKCCETYGETFRIIVSYSILFSIYNILSTYWLSERIVKENNSSAIRSTQHTTAGRKLKVYTPKQYTTTQSKNKKILIQLLIIHQH